MRRLFLTIGLALLAVTVLTATVLARAESPREALLRRVAVRALRYGDRGPEVAELQQLLLRAGVNPGKIDGIFGPLTEAAVRKIQAGLGVTVDGLAGSMTVAALERVPRSAASAEPGASRPAAADRGSTAPVAQKTPSSRMLFALDESGGRAPSSSLVLHLAGREAAPETPQEPAPEPDRFALTFNGVPDAKLLPAVLEALEKHGMKATFFVHGQTAQEQPDALRQIVAGGHEIGSNGVQDLDMRRLSPELMGAQIRAARRAISEVTGQEPVWFRPPRGLASRQVEEAAEANGMRWAMWTNVTVTDHPDLEPAQLAASLEGTVYPGAVLMIHQDRPATVAALGRLLENLTQKRYRSVTLSELGDR